MDGELIVSLAIFTTRSCDFISLKMKVKMDNFISGRDVGGPYTSYY